MSIASVFGANMGDFFSHVLQFGHDRGLLPLAAAFAAILWFASRARAVHEAYYWLAVIVLRTAATNLADLATHDWGLGYGAVIAGLAGLLAALVLVRRHGGTSSGLPAADARYWAALLTAGTLGTALGDFVTGDLEWGLGWGSLATTAAAALALLGRRSKAPGWLSYWIAIVAIRTAGTTIGDLLASRSGAALGLSASTALTGALLVAVLVLWQADGQAAGRAVRVN